MIRAQNDCPVPDDEPLTAEAPVAPVIAEATVVTAVTPITTWVAVATASASSSSIKPPVQLVPSEESEYPLSHVVHVEALVEYSQLAQLLTSHAYTPMIFSDVILLSPEK